MFLLSSCNRTIQATAPQITQTMVMILTRPMTLIQTHPSTPKMKAIISRLNKTRQP